MLLAVTETVSTPCCRKRPTANPKRSVELRYLEADLTRPGCVSTIGFSNEINGVFIPTYVEYPIGTEVGIRLIFDSGIIKAAHGIVEWARELHPLTSDTEPGLGVRLLHPDLALQSLLEQHADANPPLFFDNSPPGAPVLSPDSQYTSTLSHRRPPLETISPSSDFEGLLSDIAAYLERKNPKTDSESFYSPSFLDASPGIIYATALSDIGEPRQFHGGFSAEDPGAKLFIATERFRPVGSRAFVSIELPDGRHLDGAGTVRWIRKYNPLTSSPLAPPGLGIDLDEITETADPFPLDTLFSRGAVLLCEERCSA